jgi:hypothetical protein
MSGLRLRLTGWNRHGQFGLTKVLEAQEKHENQQEWS